MPLRERRKGRGQGGYGGVFRGLFDGGEGREKSMVHILVINKRGTNQTIVFTFSIDLWKLWAFWGPVWCCDLLALTRHGVYKSVI